MPLTTEQAEKIWDILAEHGGAPEFDRDSFIAYQTENDCTEWRFQGIFGFGGKFWINADKWYVNQYREDRNEILARRAKEINEMLADLKKSFENGEKVFDS